MDQTGHDLAEKIAKMDTQVVETLKQQKEFVGKSLFSNHREKLMSSFSPHMKQYAYFDHPSYSTLKENMQSVVKDPRFQERVAENMRVHGADIDELIGDENIVQLRPQQRVEDELVENQVAV